jgi:hypothetical protein
MIFITFKGINSFLKMRNGVKMGVNITFLIFFLDIHRIIDYKTTMRIYIVSVTRSGEQRKIAIPKALVDSSFLQGVGYCDVYQVDFDTLVISRVGVQKDGKIQRD